MPPPAHAPTRFDWITAFRQLRGLARQFLEVRWDRVHADFRAASYCVSKSVMYRFGKLGGHAEHLLALPSGVTKPELAYRAIEDMARRATESGDVMRAAEIRGVLKALDHIVTREIEKLTTKHGVLDALSTQATRAMQTMQTMQTTQTMQTLQTTQTTQTTQTMQTLQTLQTMLATQAVQRPPVRVGPTTSATPPGTAGWPVIVATTTVAPPGRLDISVPPHPIVVAVNPAFPEPAGGLVHATGVSGPPPASGLSGPSLCEATGAEAGDLGRGRLDPPATVSGATAAHPAATETIVTPSLGETSSLWLQPIDPVPAPRSVPFDSGLHHAGETVQPPAVTTTASGTEPAPGAALPTPSWLNDDFAVERVLLAGRLPPGFDASRLIDEAGRFGQLGLAGELVAGRLPILTIYVLIEGYRATDEGSRNARYIEYLRSLKESIERALRDAYPGRVDAQWLDFVEWMLRERGELGAPSAASATGVAELEVTEIARLPGTGEGASHPAPPPSPSAPERTAAGAVAPPTAADPWRIRPPGMSGEPHPVAFDRWSAPPGPSSRSRVVHTETIRTPVLPTGAPPGWQGAETPGFARAASGAVELPFSHREALARQFRAEDALLAAELALQTGSADALGWSATRRRTVLDDLYRLNNTAQVDPAAAVAMADIDWSAIETLARILNVPPPSP